MSEAAVGHDYDRWLTGRSLSAKGYSFLASVPGAILINTAVFNLHRVLQLKPEQRLLDIGCGRGSLLQLLGSRVRFEHRPVGVDLSRSMLDGAPRGGRSAAFMQASATNLPFADDSFEVATSAYVLKHLDDDSLLAFFRELRRVLSYGGIGVLWEFAPTASQRLDAWHHWVLTRGVAACNLRDYTRLSAFALGAGFEWVGNAALRPFLFPPIPRVSMIVGKAPRDWTG